LRVAASIVLATGLGVAAGHLVPRGQTTTDVPVNEVADSLGLTDIAIESATGLPIQFDPGTPQEGDAES
jgi:hypothetical protein